MKNKKHEMGFTLIELLIVVAIIAILAAIAVPNFLEAQTRSKVSRVHNDMRTLATAFESYNVDHNTYPQPCAWASEGTVDPFRLQAYVALSTPIAYMTSGFLYDPFIQYGSEETRNKTIYECGFTQPGVRAADLDDLVSAGTFTKRTMYLASSFGPDRNDDTNIGGFGTLVGGKPNASAVVYDATNGTKSSGDIYRINGTPEYMRYYTSEANTPL